MEPTTDYEPQVPPVLEPATVPTPTGPVLVYSPERPYRLELYREPPGPGVVPFRAEVPRGLAIVEPETWMVLREQPRFCEQVQTLGWNAGQAPPPSLAEAWAGIPRKQAVAMLARTRDELTLERLLALAHHLDVRGVIAEILAEMRAPVGRRRQ